MPKLEGIVLKGDDITDAGIKAVAGCKDARQRDILGAKQITDAG